MPRHLRPPERRTATRVGVLAIAMGVALLVIAGMSTRPAEDGDDDLDQPATATSATVLGEVIERTTLPDAPPASAVGFTTTSASDESPSEDRDPAPRTATTSPTVGPPESTTPPPTTTSSPSSPTSTTEASTTTETTDITAPPVP